MLSLLGRKFQHCDKLIRRDFLRAGALGIGGLRLADLLRLDATAGTSSRGESSASKSVINIHLDGGPPSMDMIDLKPAAPLEVRGEFQPIATRIPGFQICELMPRLAQAAERFAFVRSLVGAAGRHDAFQCQSGFDDKSLASIGGRPALGCVVTKLKGSPRDTAPTFVDLMQGRPLVRNSARPGFLGPAFGPFRPDISSLFARPLEDGMKIELARLGGEHTTEMTLNEELTVERLGDRRQLLRGLDNIARRLDASGMMAAMDRFEQQAAGMLTSGRFARAMDLASEDPRIVQRYTAPRTGAARSYTSEDERAMQKLLLARRLIEAGVRVVNVSFSDFDTHTSNFARLRHLLPVLDVGLTALISDLEERGMLDDVTIVAWGEFGRTPKINAKAGRDHWPAVGMALLAGGGLKTGQVIGATDRTASAATARPVHYQDVVATLYHQLGIDARKTTVPDTSGRPQYLLDRGEPIRELI